MGKKNKANFNSSKTKPRKDNSAFKVTGSKVGKSKDKTKGVTSALKKKLERKVQTDMRTEKADAAFEDIRGKMLEKPVQPSKAQDERPMRIEDNNPLPDLDEAAAEFAKL